jgi:hypothetical protein
MDFSSFNLFSVLGMTEEDVFEIPDSVKGPWMASDEFQTFAWELSTLMPLPILREADEFDDIFGKRMMSAEDADLVMVEMVTRRADDKDVELIDEKHGDYEKMKAFTAKAKAERLRRVEARIKASQKERRRKAKAEKEIKKEPGEVDWDW